MLDDAGRSFDLERRIRRLEARVGQSEPRTFIVGGTITTGVYVPPLHVSIDPDRNTPEVRFIYGFRGLLGAGTCQLSWSMNGVDITGASVHLIDTTPASGDVVLSTPLAVPDGAWIRPTIIAATSAANLSAAVVFTMAPR